MRMYEKNHYVLLNHTIKIPPQYLGIVNSILSKCKVLKKAILRMQNGSTNINEMFTQYFIEL
jgi:hypothetical protein